MNEFIVPHEILEVMTRDGFRGRTFLVGGCVRDHFLGQKPKDWDLAFHGTPAELIELGLIPAHTSAPVFLTRTLSGELAEIACTRREIQSGVTSEHIQFETGVSIQEDLRRRDFTCNSIAWCIDRGFIDPFNGIRDLRNRRLRITDHATFVQSPERILRWFAMIARFNLTPMTRDVAVIRRNLRNILNIPTEQLWRQGFSKIFRDSRQPGMQRMLQQTLWPRVIEALGLPPLNSSNLENGMDVLIDWMMMGVNEWNETRFIRVGMLSDQPNWQRIIRNDIMALPFYNFELRQQNGTDRFHANRIARWIGQSPWRERAARVRFVGEDQFLELVQKRLDNPFPKISGDRFLAQGHAPGPEIARLINENQLLQDRE